MLTEHVSRSHRLRERALGNTGLSVSEISLGTAAFSGERYGPVPKNDAVACVEQYLLAGGNFIDTARRYGDSEGIVGEVLSAHGARSGVVLATKTAQNSPDAIEADLASSLKALRTDRIDVYYLHRASDDATTMRRSLEALRRLKSAGAIRAAGMSVPSSDVDRFTLEIARRYLRTGLVDVIQLNFSAVRQGMRAMFAEANAHGIGLVARGVLENGFLSGKYGSGQRFTDHRARWSKRRIDRMLALAEEANRAIVKPPYGSLPEVAIRFVLDEPAIASALVGVRTAAQVEEALRAAELPALSPEVHRLFDDRYSRRSRDFNLGHWWDRWIELPRRLVKRFR
jgi:aryl-alcohol dehydrogenase-like predicted oxidoreductase